MILGCCVFYACLAQWRLRKLISVRWSEGKTYSEAREEMPRKNHLSRGTYTLSAMEWDKIEAFSGSRETEPHTEWAAVGNVKYI